MDIRTRYKIGDRASKQNATRSFFAILSLNAASSYLALAKQTGLTLRLPHHEAAVVEAGAVLLQPRRDETLVCAGQQMPEISVR